MRRIGAKGTNSFTPISWDDALGTIAGNLSDTIEQYSGEALRPFIGSGSTGLLQGAYSAGRRFWNALGASRHGQTICTIAGGFAQVTRSATTASAWIRRRLAILS
jgi:anaerobic selenocysteine-containing dehydrogenase